MAWCDHIFGDRPRWWGINQGVIGGQDRIWLWNFDGTVDLIGVNYTPGVWTHITIVHDGGVMRAYKNGVLVGDDGQRPDATAKHRRAAYPAIGGRDQQRRACVDVTAARSMRCRLWSTARSAGEIQADMNRALAGNEPGLAAYYRMSDGAGLTLTDDSGTRLGWDALRWQPVLCRPMARRRSGSSRTRSRT